MSTRPDSILDERPASRLKAWLFRTSELLQPTPDTGRTLLDLAWIICIGILQHAILPTFAAGLFLVDVMTPWLVAGFVRQSLPRATARLLVGALVLEQHQAAPAGMYVCAYWVIAVVLKVVRSSLSWRHIFPWVVTFAVCEIWVIAFETFVAAIVRGGVNISLDAALAEVARVLAAVTFGLIICRPLTRAEAIGEE